MRVFDKRETATKYKPILGDTLGGIAATHPKCTPHAITWQELARYNWGTAENAEVNRALVEIIGCSLDGVNPGDPSATVLDPAFGPDGEPKELLIPEIWNRPSLPLEKAHQLKVRVRKPMPAVAITELSPWFIPETESCDLKYALEGVEERADKVGWTVWASRYQSAVMDEATPELSDLQKFTFSDCDVPICAEQLSANLKPRQGEFAFKNKANDDWKGESTAANGVLKPRAGQKRHITVANSPYTVQFTFHKKAADFKEDAAHTCPRILLESFWPYWLIPPGAAASPPASPPSPILDDDSLKVKWKVENTGGLLAHGQILIWDKRNDASQPVYRKALGQNDLKDGEHTFDWAAIGGRDLVNVDAMPYRAQIQAHSGMETAEGLALAVMHTEVRLFAPPELDTHQDPVEDPQCFDLELAPVAPDDTVIPVNTRKWYQLQLAKTGLHPGPVNGEDHNHYRLAHVDFKRSFTRNASAPFERMRAVFGEDADFQAALKRVGDAVEATQGSPASPPAAGSLDRVRPAFGDPAQLDSINGGEDLTNVDDINNRLRDKAQDMILWIDGRHYYTSTVSPDSGVVTDLPDGAFVPRSASPLGGPASPVVGSPGSPVSPAGAGQSLMGMEDFHGELTSGDGVVDLDAQSVARPWIPLMGAVPLLSKSQELNQAAKPALTDQMRKSTGPIRIDWRFFDLGEDLTRIDVGRYNLSRLRTRKFLDETSKSLETKHEGKKAQNCPEAYGGLRPGAGSPSVGDEADYYKAPFAFGDESLAPFRAYDHTATHRICSLAHDDLGQDAAKVYKKLIGKAGIYFHPSRIAGDGYQVRACVSFEEVDGTFLYPNHEVLRRRYQKLPQTHSCKLRNWRKTSFRAYVAWAPAAEQKWNTWRHPVVLDFRQSFVHFALEPNAINPLTMSGLYPAGAERTAFLDKLEGACTPNIFDHGNNRTLEADYLWPWNTHAQLGAEFNQPFQTSWSGFTDVVTNNSYSLFASPMILDVIYRIERSTGRLRGHILVEFRGSKKSWVGQYRCTACNTDQALLQDAAGALGAPVSDCCGGPALERLEEYEFSCNSCGQTDLEYHPASNPPAGGGPWNCPDGTCAGDYDQSAGPTDITEEGGDSMINTAMGLALGGSILITLNDNEDWPWWTHEIGHNRQLQHAGKEFGFQVAQHDSAPNTHEVNWPAGAPANPLEAQWDRDCTMTYQTSRLAGPDGDDRQQFCGKCVLKGRGWRVENLPDAGTLGPGVAGP